MSYNEALVSVICTAFNHGKYIRDTLEGFVMQKTDFKFEVLVHDDASTDNTADIIREYYEKYPDIIKPVIQTENQYSKGVLIIDDILYPLAKGEYLAFCEGDDFWTDENKLQRQIDFLKAHPEYVACVHNSTILDCTGKNKDELMVANNAEHDVNFEEVIFGMRNAYQTSSLVVKKQYVVELPDFYHTAVKFGFGDFPLAIWFTIAGKVRFLPYNMSTYRLMSSPYSWSYNNVTEVRKIVNNKEGVIAMLEAVKDYVSEERKSVLDKAILEQKFYILELQENFSEMKKFPFTPLWNALSAKYKIKLFIKQYFPVLFKILKRIKNKI